ncbi:hypothetical protein MLD38_019036 [Melastoma candidum]|nr:hypothetical protein MLD38_019036 [Melastoma candidum]
MFRSPPVFKFSSGTSLDENALPSLESTVASSSGSAATGLFGSLQTTAAPAFARPESSSSSPSTGFSFGAMSSSAGSISVGENISSTSSKSIFGSSGGSTSSNGPSNFTSNGCSPASSVAPIFGAAAPYSSPVFPFGQTSTGKNNDQMNAEDVMAEDTMTAATPSASLFGQQPVSPAPPPSSNFVFGSGASSPFQFGGQPSFAPPTNPSPLAASGSLGFNSSGGGSSFSLGTGGGDKSGRKIIRVKRRK